MDKTNVLIWVSIISIILYQIILCSLISIGMFIIVRYCLDLTIEWSHERAQIELDISKR